MGTGDALNEMPGRKKRDAYHFVYRNSAPAPLVASTSSPIRYRLRPHITRTRTSMSFTSTNMTETIRNKRQTSEFPNQVGPNGGMDNDANNSNLNKVKKFFNKFMDAFDEMVTKIQNMVRSSEADGTVPTTA